MKKKKYKFLQIVPAVGKGCHTQISKEENYLFNPIKIMKKKGFISEFWTLKKDDEKKVGYVDGIKVKRFSNTFSLLIHLFLDKDIKLVHAHLRPYLPSLLSPLTLKKCVLTPHTYELGSNWFIRKASIFFMKRFNRVIALTPYEMDKYIENGLKKGRVVLLPHAIDWDFFSKKTSKDISKIKKEYNISKDDFIITSVANFRKFKNLDSMLAAFGIFNLKVKKSKFLVVGINQLKNPGYKEQSSAKFKHFRNPEEVIKEYDLSKKVVFTGGLDHKRVREILSISNVFINNSDPETMGLAVYEAACAGVPLCLSNIGSFTSVFKDMALYSPPRDEVNTANNLLKYFKNPNLRKKHGKSLQKYMKKWNYPIFIKKLTKLYFEILSD